MNDFVQPSQVLELQTWIAPLGMRFWDMLEGRVVSDGLSVTAYPMGQNTRCTQAFTNRSGVYIFRNLPGLRDFERGAGAEQFLSGTPDAAIQGPPRRFTIEVVDTFGRFLPFALSVMVPFRGLYTWTCEQTASPPEVAETLVPLFSAPTRSVGSGLAVIRATLWDSVANLPAAWAVLEASIAGRRVARGFADSDGQVALFFASPAPTGPAFDPSGPPLAGGTNTTLSEQTWVVQLQSYYAPGVSQSPGQSPQAQSAPAQGTREGYPYQGRMVLPFPDLCAILWQAPASLWSDEGRTSPLTEVTLRFGQELVVRSSNTTPRSLLLISPAT